MGDDYSAFVKDEAIMLTDSDDYGGGCGGGGVYADDGFSSSVDTPPFLRKTFQMVEDKGTDEIISWSCSRKSFIVFDPFRFSRDLLPKYFKHNNFSSFIRQLNTYVRTKKRSSSVSVLFFTGLPNLCVIRMDMLACFLKGFKKVDSERWEFANEGFQGGKKQLLRNIKRKKQQQGITETDFIKELKKEQAELKMEILKMKEQQERTNTILANVEDRVQNYEFKQHKMFLFMAKSFASPLFLRQLIHHLRQTRRQKKLMMLADSQIIRKKPKLIDQEDEEEEELENMEQEVKIISDDSMDGEGSIISSSPDNSEYILWEKLLEDDMIICENKKEEEVDNYIVQELEDLINQQPTGF